MVDCKCQNEKRFCFNNKCLLCGKYCDDERAAACPARTAPAGSRVEKTEHTIYADGKPTVTEITVSVFVDSKKAEEKLERIERRVRRLNRLLRQTHKELAALGIKSEEVADRAHATD